MNYEARLRQNERRDTLGVEKHGTGGIRLHGVLLHSVRGTGIDTRIVRYC